MIAFYTVVCELPAFVAEGGRDLQSWVYSFFLDLAISLIGQEMIEKIIIIINNHHLSQIRLEVFDWEL